MKYTNTSGKKYLIYCINPARDRWKIEPYPFTGEVWEVDGEYVDKFIRKNRLLEVAE